MYLKMDPEPGRRAGALLAPPLHRVLTGKGERVCKRLFSTFASQLSPHLIWRTRILVQPLSTTEPRRNIRLVSITARRNPLFSSIFSAFKVLTA